MENEIKRRTVFISYAWTNNEHKEKVFALAQRLVYSAGTDVLIDLLDLKAGQDKYAFMEKCVNDPTVDKVLLLCNEEYASRADSRTGGVGTETMVISDEIYTSADQQKFIPVLFNVQDDQVFLPSFLKTRIYIDLSTDEKIEENFEKLVCCIYDKPLYTKPKLGNLPDYITKEEAIQIVGLRAFKGKFEKSLNPSKPMQIKLLDDFLGEFISVLYDYRTSSDRVSADNILQKIETLKPIRDIYIDCLEAAIASGFAVDDLIIKTFETIYNDVMTADSSYNTTDFEDLAFLCYEMMVCITIVVLNYEQYEALYRVLNHEYLLYTYRSKKSTKAEYTFMEFQMPFRKHSFLLQQALITASGSNYISPAAELLIRRIKSPLITEENIINADTLLCQLSSIYHKGEISMIWFPMTYIYISDPETQCSRLRSQHYCRKILPLFGVKTISELRDLFVKYPVSEKIKFRTRATLRPITPAVTAFLNVEAIGSRP